MLFERNFYRINLMITESTANSKPRAKLRFPRGAHCMDHQRRVQSFNKVNWIGFNFFATRKTVGKIRIFIAFCSICWGSWFFALQLQ